MHKAKYWEKRKDGKANEVICRLCPHTCLIKEGKTGLCNARVNIGGVLYSLVYGQPVALNADPIEKKPLYHFLPGTTSLSIGTVGCNLFCKNCQNWDISRAKPADIKTHKDIKTQRFAPEDVVRIALENRCTSISYTYNEPTVFHEFAVDCARLARKKGLKNIIVTNGFISKEAALGFAEVMDAANVDLKSFSDSFYKDICRGSLDPILKTLKIYHKRLWLEITNLIIDRKNDSMEEIEKMCRWVKEELSTDVPLHFSRSFPMFKMTEITPTPKDTLVAAKKAAEKYLDYVYIGNADIKNSSNTYCPGCKRMLISREGYSAKINHKDLKENRCSCGRDIPGIFA
ncbi:AmmeMemoRadiSam system radical SAM enzyme [Candidatus Woesearchaeota archaeon]|nr:AmmeMemoRadiSam system radical SAM enzyme [Candidatus Woesearchaeota archaeon]